MSNWPFRITEPVLDVVEALVTASEPVHGWAVADSTGQSGPNVYRALRRLQDAGWVGYRWDNNPELSPPPRRLYWLTAEGERRATALLAERRGGATLQPDGEGVHR